MSKPASVEAHDGYAIFRGRPYVTRDNEDGSVLFQPARVVSEAQHEYDTNPELRELLARAAESPTVQRTYSRRHR